MTSLLDELRNSVVATLCTHKAEDVVVLDVGEKCQITKYMVIASGSSSNHVRALVGYVKKEACVHSKVHIEGLKEGHWVVVSLRDIIVHIFRPEVREYYDVEGLWNHDMCSDNVEQ